MSRDPAAPAESDEHAIITHRTLTYSLIDLVMGLYLRIRHRRRAEGAEHIPEEGGALIVANHQSYLDIPLISSTTRRHVAFVARDTLADSRVLKFVMRECGAVLIRRGVGDRAALRAMQEHLDRGDLVAIFPEGTRSADGSVGEFRGGALLAARKARVPIVPAAIRGMHGVWPRERRLPGPGRLGIRFSAPVDPRAPGALEAVRGAVVASAGSYEAVDPI